MLLGRFLIFAGFLFPAVLLGHHSVEETIRELTQKITKVPTAELYFKRAIEYRALRKTKESGDDLRAALRLSPHHYSSKMALARLLMASGNYDESRTYSEELRAAAKVPARKIAALFLSAELAHARGDDKGSLQICDSIQKEFPVHDESIELFQAYLLIKSDKSFQAAQLLRKSFGRTQGVVLRNSWIDASLVAGQFEEVWPVIEKELRDSRYKAAWLIRRARVAQIQGQNAQMQKDLALALEELKTRIKTSRPDLTLVSDRGLARAMMGDKKLAKSDLSLLQKSGFPAQSYVFLEKLLEDGS